MSEVERNSDILGGVPVFQGTRVPIRNLFDYSMQGGKVQEFLEDFPTVSFEQVRQIMQAAEVAVEA